MINSTKYTLTTRWKLFTGIFLLAGVLLLCIGGYFLFASDETQLQTEEVTTIQFDVNSTYYGEVSGESDVWENETVLRENSLYLYNSTSTIDFETGINVDDIDDETITIQQEAKLEQRAIVSGNVVWSRESFLMGDQIEFDEVGSSDGIAFEFDAIETREHLSGVDATLGELATIENTILIETSYTVGDDERVEIDPIVYQVQFSEHSYFITTDSDTVFETQTTEVITEEQVPIVSGEFISMFIIGGLSFVVSAIWVPLYHRKANIPKIHREYLHDKFGEWISTGDMYIDTEKNYIRMDDAKSVIDIAIDSNRRVIYKDSLHIYMVSVDNQIYYYSYEDAGVEKWIKSLGNE